MIYDLVPTDFGRILTALRGSEVEFIVIGGVAGNVHGNARVTWDIDVVYRRDRGNHQRLALALAPLAPKLRGGPDGLPFRWDAETIERGLNFTLRTDAGDVDVLGEVAGGGTYTALLPRSLETDPFGVPCRVVDLPTLIRLKRAAGRRKDLEAIAELELLLEMGGGGPDPVKI